MGHHKGPTALWFEIMVLVVLGTSKASEVPPSLVRCMGNLSAASWISCCPLCPEEICSQRQRCTHGSYRYFCAWMSPWHRCTLEFDGNHRQAALRVIIQLAKQEREDGNACDQQNTLTRALASAGPESSDDREGQKIRLPKEMTPHDYGQKKKSNPAAHLPTLSSKDH
jgi:hypothetical protein